MKLLEQPDSVAKLDFSVYKSWVDQLHAFVLKEV